MIRGDGKYWDREVETMPLEKLFQRQLEKLKWYIEYAYKNSPYYRQIMDEKKMKPSDIRTVEDYYENFPFITKGTLIEDQQKNYPLGNLLAVNPVELTKLYVTPGPFFIPYTDEDYDIETNLYGNAYYSCGARKEDIVDLTLTYHWTLAGTLIDDAFRKVGCAVIPGGPGQSQMHAETLKQTKATILYAFPSFANQIGESAKEIGLDPQKDFSIRLVIIVGEVRSEEAKSALGKVFNAKVKEVYGTTELGVFAYECEAGGGFHINGDVVFETIDPKTGKHLPYGEPGEIVATSFTKRALPIIRYRTSDLVGPLNMGPCPCGRTTPKMPRILGRASDIAKVKGLFVVPRQVENVIAKFPQLGRYQIIVDHPKTVDTLTIMIEYKEKIDLNKMEDILVKELKEAIKLTAEIKLVSQGTIPEKASILDDRRKV
jgi:phenylacetate-CoA ligase